MYSSKKFPSINEIADYNSTRIALCPNGSSKSIDNYVFLRVDGAGFIAIKQTIFINGEI